MNKSHAAEIKQLLLNVKAGKLTADEAKVLLHQYREPVSGGALEDSNTPAAEGSTYKHALQLLITALEEEINIPPAKIRADLPMEKYGLDSVMAINLIRRLEIKLGELPKTLFYEYQTLQEVAEYLATHAAALLDVPAPEKQEQVAVTAPLTPGLPATELFADHDIAIIGVAGRYPMAADLSEFWQQLKAGKDCISEIPAERWPADKYFNPDKHADGSTYSKWGGFLRDIDKFDPLFFNITPKEAAQMDPQERLFLQTIWHTLEDAGYTKKQLWGKAVGVYVGLMYSQYQLLGAEENSKGNMVTPGFSYASVANRVSYFFNFKGPSMAVDSMCSSSLTTIHLACESIRSGESEMALAGGVNLNLHPAKYLYLSQGKFASSEGKCRTFGAGGDGYVPGEGVGAVLLKSRAAAERDGDHIYAVIKGNAINHGGKTNGYTVPNPVAQTEVISRAWLHAGVPLQALNYIEAHGTGTSLGDPIEMAGLVQALAGSGIKAQSCATGAVKSNIGHLESAAGIASVTKVLLQLKYRQLVPSIHSARLNPHIRFEETPFYVQRTLTSWDQVSIQEGGTAVLYPLTAGISSFGAGGANSHLVLQEHITTLQVAYTDPVLIVLSARTTAALEQYARDTIAWLQREEDELLRALPGFLYNLAYTLQTGREAFANRLAVKTHSVSQLLQQLQAFLSAAPATDVWFHHASDDDTPVQTPVVKEMATFAAAWVKGAVIDWRQLYAGTSPAPRRISGPLYPFAKDRYWIEQVKDNRQNTHVALHPLLHRNISILGTQQFESTFDTSLFYLNDHRFRAVPLMPGAAWVEAARAASELSVHAGEAVQLKDVYWRRKFSGGSARIITRLVPDGEHVRLTVVEQEAVDRERLLFECAAITAPLPVASPLDIPVLLKACVHRMEAAECYRRFSQAGLDYGPAFRTIRDLRYNNYEVLAAIDFPDAGKEEQQPCCWQPAILDAAFQSILPLVSTTEDRYFLPSGAGAVIGAVTLNTAAWVHARKKSEAVFDLAIADQDGDILVRIYDFTIREWHAAVQQQQEVPEGLCLLQPAWEEAPLATDTALTAKLLVFTTPGAPVNPALKQQYPPTYIRFVYPAYAGEDGAAHYTLRQQDGQQAYDELWDSLLQQGWQPDHIITDRSFSGTDHFLHWFRLSKSIVSKRPQRILLQYVYPAGDSREEPFAAAVHAFLKSVALECPAIRGSVVAYDQAALPAKYFAGEEGRVKYRHGVRYRQVLTAPDIKPVSLSSSGFRPDGVYIIIGGAGGIGLAMAKYLAASYKARLVLVGRSAADENTTAMITALDAAGGHASYHAADVSSIVHMKELVAYVQGKWGKINGIIHAAGVLRDALLINKQPEQAMAVLQSKINGVQVLHECMAGISFDFLLLCSSVVSLLGNTGQCDYAYANGYLDGFASWRNEEAIAGKCHGHTMVLNWPYWKNGGMQLDKGILEWMNAHLGWRPLEDNTALWCVEYALQSAVAQWAVFYGDVTRIRKALQPSENTGGPASREDHPAVSSQPPVAMTALLKQLFAAEIRLDESKVSMRETFENYGIDSVNAMNLTRALEQYTGALPKTLFYEYRTLTALQEYLLQEFPDAWPGSRPAEDIILPAGDTQVITSIPIVTQVSIVQQDIAIVGLAGQYPMADTLEAFWENLKAGKDCITEIPANRWDWQAYFDPERNKDGKSYSRWGGFLEDADKFDPLFFSISPREAKIMDPQERVFLQTVWHLLEDAGYSKKQLSGSNTGVFVGVMYGQYQLYGAAPDNQEQGVIPSSLHASVANRVSYFYDFTGPSIALDTMCSSSLTAIHLACNSLLNGDCNLAVAGGVNITTHPNKYLLLSQFNFASSDGRCRSFGDGGDGYVPGEGSGAVLLKPLQQALLDNDHIYGVIKGTAANHGGRSNGYTVPTPLAQASVIDKALQRANVDPQQISYVEAHGTGTALGDPVELAGLVKALRPDGKHANICSIGAVKSNIGHLESAAGIAGLTKVLLQLQHKQLAPSLHSNVLNTNLDFSTTPFYVQQQLQDWGTTVIPTPEGARELPRLAGLSSFGAGGANAHLIIAEYPQLPVTATGQPGEQLIVLSAFDEQSLRNVVSGLITYLEGNVVAVIPDHLEDTLKQLAALLLDISPEEIKPGIALDEYGFDTMITSIWLTKAGEKYGFDPAMYDYEGCSTLTDYARRMVGLYRLSTGETSGISLTSLGYTLLAGREPLPVRLALVTASIGQLTAQLKDYVATGTATRLWTGTAGRQEDAAWLEISQLARQGQWDLLAQRWVAGGDIDPALVFPAKRSRLKLPLYPFRKERYWVNEKPTPSPAAPTWKSGSVSKRHLISSNNPVIRDHVVSGQMILPAVAYLLIAIDTAEEYTGRRGWQPVRVNWLQPFTLTGSDSGDLHAVLTRSEEEIQFTIKDSSDKIYSTGSLVQTTAATYEIPSPHSGGQQLSAATAYKQLDGKGLAYGPYYRLIEQVSFNAQQVTGKLRLPETGMNAALLDAALQVVAAWVCAVEPAASLKVPYALSAFRWHQAPVGVAYIRAVSPLKNTYNIDMLNEDGQLCAQLQGLEVKELTGKKADWPLTYYQPVWEHRDLLSERTSPFDENTEAELLCVLPGAYSPVQASGLRRWFSRPLLTVTTGRTMREITPGHWELNATDIAEWTKILTEYEGIKSICWIAPYHTDAATADALGACEEAGILSFHALIKACIRNGYQDMAMTLNVITVRAQSVFPDEITAPFAATFPGYCLSLSRELPLWKVSCIDLDDAALNGEAPTLLQQLLHTGKQPGEPVWMAFREGRGFVQQLLPLTLPVTGQPAFRKGGVYLIAGGAGGIGSELGKYLAMNFQATIVFLGRRAYHEDLAKYDRLIAGYSGRFKYIQTDISDADAVAAAVQQVKTAYGVIHGVVHAAIVLRDSTIANMEAASLQEVLAPKVRGSVVLTEALKNETLDFYLFCSSAQSFSGNAGQSNYCAASTFEDAWARYAATVYGLPVRILNWGYWGDVGIVATDNYRERLAAQGIGAISTEEGMAAIAICLQQQITQVIPLKIREQVHAALGIQSHRKVFVQPVRMPSVIQPLTGRLEAVPVDFSALQRIITGFTQLHQYAAAWLLAAFHKMGALHTSQEKYGPASLKEQLHIIPAYNRLWEALLDILYANGYISITDNQVTVLPAAATASLPEAVQIAAFMDEYPQLSAHTTLLRSSLDVYNEILTGRVRATDLLFPAGSPALLEKIYQGNPVVDYCNELVATAVKGYIEEQAARGNARPVRILEIGAGTGSTTGKVLHALNDSPHAWEYCFTDISARFVQLGRQQFGSWPQVDFNVLDIERPVTEQDYVAGSYDVIIAANVLHATVNMTATLREVKHLLAPCGVLVLNEVMAVQPFTTYIFGLLDGWWRFEDASCRIKNGPLLSPALWKLQLGLAGFRHAHIAGYHNGKDYTLGQLVLIAESDGLLSMHVSQENTVNTPVLVTAPAPAITVPATTIGTDMTALVTGIVAEALEMKGRALNQDQPFAELGVDSITGVAVIAAINKKLGLKLGTNVLFDYTSIKELANYIRQLQPVPVAVQQPLIPSEEKRAPAGSLSDIVYACVQETLETTMDIDRQQPFSAYGIDSILGVRLINLLNKRTGLKLQTSVLFDYVNIAELSGHIHSLCPVVPVIKEEKPVLVSNDKPRAVHTGSPYKAVVVHGPGSIADVTIAQLVLPDPQEEEVQIAVKAFSLNFGDLLCVKGLYPTMPPFPFTPGFEIAGIVKKTGAKVTGFKPGDPVIALMGEGLGAQAELANVWEGSVIAKPENVSYEEACSLPIVYLTMEHAFRLAAIRPGEKILIQTAAGGTGLIAVQMALGAGAEIFATAGSADKLQYLQRAGVHHLINYQEEDFSERVKEITGGKGVDVVINTLSGDAIQKGLDLLTPGGRYIEIAMTGLRSSGRLNLSRMTDNQVFYSLDLRKLLLREPLYAQRYLQEMVSALQQGAIKPVVGKIFEFDQLLSAYDYMENRANIGKIVVRTSAAEVPAPPPEVPARQAVGDIAIIGMSGRFPGADDLNMYWQNLAAGKSAIREVPAERWDIDAYYSANPKDLDKTHCRKGGFLDNIDLFDPVFFNISGKEALFADPQQRLFLEQAWNALEDAGYANDHIANARCCIYIGGGSGDYLTKIAADGWLKEAQSFWGNDASITAARLAYHLNLKGAAVALNTACSSSLVAIHLACRSIQQGESDMAVAGGVFVTTTPDFYVINSNAEMLSPDGICRAFDNNANGYVPGEGVAAIILKPLAKALADGDQIYAVIKGSGINQDGKTNGITAPGTKSQTALETEVYQRYHIHPDTIGMVECHGTGTRLGDPIEMEALTNAFRAFTDKKGYCAVGSVKTAIGHAVAAAGIASVIKAVLSLRHQQIPPTLHFETPNEQIPFAESPFYVITKLKDWAATNLSPRRAAVSSFGFSGTNAHMVLEEAPARTKVRSQSLPPAFLVALSAKTAAALQQKAADLLTWLQQPDQRQLLTDIAYTLHTGRMHFKYRLALIVTNTADLITQLQQWTNGENGQVLTGENGVVSETGQARGAALIEEYALGRHYPTGFTAALRELAALYVGGGQFDWEPFYKHMGAGRISLPLYPFERRSYWLAAKPVAAATPATPHKEAPARPLIDGYHTTASPQEEGVLFHKVLTANDEVAGEHIVQGNMVMPAVAHIEMAVEAFTMLYNLKEYELHDLLWLHPVVVETTLDVTVLLKQVDKDIHFEISSTEAGTRRVHSRGRFVPAITVSRLPQLDMADIRKELKSESVELPYLLLGDYGIQYGPFFEGLIRVWEGKYTTLGMIALPGKHADDVSKYVIHPGITDAAAQAIIAVEEGLYRKEKNSSLLPFALKRLVYQAPLPANAYAYVKCGATAGSYDVCITDVEGNVCVYMEEMNFRELIQPFVPLYYQPIWKEVPAASPVTGLPGNVLLVHNGTAVTEGWRQHIARHYSNSRIQQVLIPLKDKGDNGGEYTQLVKAALPATDIYFLAGEAGREGLFGLFHLVKTLIAEHISVDRLSVWIADNEAPYEAALTGFVCSMKQELPSWKVLTVQVPADMNREEATRIIQDPGDEIMPVVAFRGGRRYVKRICDAVIPEENTSLLRVGGTYVITGGAGGIGYHLSLYLARTFRAKLLWAGRSPLTDEILAKMRVIEMLRGEVHYAQVNISEEAAGHVLLEAAMQRFGSINGVIHAAAVLCDKRIAQMTAEDMQTVLLPKEQGSLQLWKAFEKASPDFFAFFSSIQSFAGNAGQANYGAANAFMDAFALQLQATATFPVKVINWGYWGGVGLSKDAWLGKQLLSKGLLPLTIQEGVTAFEQVLSAAAPQYIVMKATAELLRQSGIESNTATSASTEQTNNPPTLKITAMPEKYENPSSLVKNAIIAALADVLRLDREIFDDNTPYMNYGIDSLMAVDIVNKVSDELKINLRVTDLFNYANISKLAEYITQHFPETVAPAIVPPPVTAPVSTATREVTPEAPVKVQPPEEQYPVKDTDIAIIGKAGQFPGAPDAATFWQKLAEGYNGVKEITRWPAEVLENSQTRHGGLLDNIDVFDPLFFNISPKEAELMDTQQRLFLQTVWHALEDAAYSDREMDGRSCCVYVGCEAGDYNGVLQESADRHHGYTFTGTASSILAARISYFLNLQGASVPVDTACSSSLVAIHLACEALRSSQTEMAIAGGVTVMHTPLYFILASNAGMLSPDGKCKTFDDSANGFVPAEAIGAVVLKRLKDALRDGDNIQAVITASGINQDGKTNGITAPSAPSQIALLRSVYQQYGIHPEDISCIEAHGTGTKLGDPIEVEALTTAYNYYTRKKQYCAIGSVKTNIGHAGTAAGVAGLFKLILSLQHRQLAPSLHCHQVNRLIEFDKGPFYVNTRLQDWHTEKGKQRTAAISSFGFSGTNAHLVLQEAPATAALPGNQPPAQLLVLSAKTPEALQQRVVQLAAWLQEQPETLSLTDVAFVAGAGRSHFLHRVAIVATSRQQLVRQLGALLQQQPVADTWTNNPALNGAAKQPTRDLVRRVTASRGEPGVYLRELALLAEAYVAGSEVDFGLLYEGLPVKKISIPVYPFAKERYYPVREERPETIGGGHLHPLIHTNISDFSGQQFSSTFSGKEIFLNDHVVNDRKTMPGAALLEMALQAGKTAAGKFPVTISKVGWLQPLLSPTGEVVTALDVTGDWAADVQIAHADGERLYMEGKLGWNAAPLSLSDPDISTIRKRCQIQAEHHALYDTFSRIGLQYGPAFRTIQRLYAGVDEGLAHFRVPADVKPELLMVTVVDAAFQSVLALMEDEQAAAEDLWLPFALEQFYIGATPTNEGYVYITPGSKEGNNKLRYFDLLITTAAGGIVAALSDFTVKSIPARPQNGHARPAGKTVSMDQMIALMKQVESGHITAMEAEKILLQH